MRGRATLVLGVSLGTKVTGIAVLDGHELLKWNTYSFKGKWSVAKSRRILGRIERVLNRYEPQKIAVKLPPVTHRTTAITMLMKLLTESCHRHGCVIEYHTKADLKRHVPEISNPMTLMQYVTGRYPILSPEYEQESKAREPYHLKMFEAVLAAHIVA